jgi:hypothetical protein
MVLDVVYITTTAISAPLLRRYFSVTFLLHTHSVYVSLRCNHRSQANAQLRYRGVAALDINRGTAFELQATQDIAAGEQVRFVLLMQCIADCCSRYSSCTTTSSGHYICTSTASSSSGSALH